jgi:hypothetical protein
MLRSAEIEPEAVKIQPLRPSGTRGALREWLTVGMSPAVSA